MKRCKTIEGKPLLYWFTLATIMTSLALCATAGAA